MIATTLAALAIARPEPSPPQPAVAAIETKATPVADEPAVDQPRAALLAEVPGGEQIKAARAYADSRGDAVSFAVVDTDGELTGEAMNRRYISASIVKSMLLVAELRRLDSAGTPPDAATRSVLSSMITYSDNDAADAIYDRVGDAGLAEVGELYGMKRLDLNGYWASTYVTAADMARMFADLERPIPDADRDFALGLLGSVIPEQSWGIPAAAQSSNGSWQVRFKGGWRSTGLGELAHQAAELRSGDERLAIAVMTDGQPSFAYATETIEGVAQRLLAGAADPERGQAARRPARRRSDG